MTRVLVLWADDQSPNLGVRVLAEGTAALVRRVHPDAEVEYQNSGRPNVHLPVGRVRSILKERVTGSKGMMRWLASFDLIVDTRSGDSFTDAYGFARHRMMSVVHEFSAQSGTPVVLGPQTIGPFRTRTGRALARRSLNRSRLVMARDGDSARCSAELGRDVDVLTTDVVFALPRVERRHRNDVILNVSGLLWRANSHVDSSAYRATVTELYRRLRADGRSVALLAHVLDSAAPDNDVPAIREFAANVDPEAEVLVPGDLHDVRRMLADADLVIGSRMHACLNALSVGTPAIALAYSRKFSPLMRDLEWGGVLELGDRDLVASAMRIASDPALPAQVDALGVRAAHALEPAVRALEAI